MADLSAKKSNHISTLVQGVSTLLTQIATLQALVAEAQVLGYCDPQTGLQDSDFVGANAFLTADSYRKIITALATLNGTLSQIGPDGSDSFFKLLFTAKP